MHFIELDGSVGFKQAIETSAKKNKVIICGSPDDRDLLQDGIGINTDTQSILAEANTLNAIDWFNTQKSALPLEESEQKKLEGRWPGANGVQHSFALANDIVTQQPLDTLAAVIVQCEHSWQVPAYLGFGGWNNCPSPAEHCALWQFWQHKYDARIVGVSGDVIEAYVNKPPCTREEAIALAWQHFLYCPDLVEQGEETIANLAAALLDQKVWFFWWD
ncbi:DUF4253 domain-containing protein [Saccharophagus degradans]|uniref:DUF4253 domain-containing protein n=1 Tax=Saccharophagus degradans TaxID=86304 RepID=A0AAW7X9D3_9GAMM|nr:DUF4253 domain-containing protein [Saccharophagus degradans]MDO6423466.1 DUF4253 domain-containing protein [Saccharophagus degradans]MDO6606871.1 DUF4253 domain-containing protein [Saccharophagus degradans]